MKPSVSVIRFGDGYAQRIRTGINTNLQAWSLSFQNRDPDEGAAIDAFLLARGGAESFDWTPPGEISTRKFICPTWNYAPQKGGWYSLTATFEEVMDA